MTPAPAPAARLARGAAVPVPAPAAGPAPLLSVLARRLWILLFPVAFVVYSVSFDSFPILDRRHSVLGDADAANFVLILREFGVSHRFGNEWNAHHRSIGDNAQKHKIHHVLYGIVGHAAYEAIRPAYRAAGLSERQAVYSVNALVAVVNLALVLLLLGRFNPAGNPVLPFLLFYAGALSTWVFSSVPESWPLSATLVLAYLLLLGRRPLRPLALGAALGVVMLNNVFLAGLFVLLAAQVARTARGGWAWLRTTFAAGVLALGTWAGGLWVLSLFDGSFRPDRFVAYTIWFKQFTAADLPRWDPYVWKSAATNLFVNSVASNQPDPAVPQEALLATLRASPLGAVTTAAYLAVVVVAGVALFRTVRCDAHAGGWRGVLGDASLDLPLWCATMLGVTVVLFYPSGFLYSTTVVPVMAVALCRWLDLRFAWQKALLYGTLALLLLNNLSQVLRFREALRALS